VGESSVDDHSARIKRLRGGQLEAVDGVHLALVRHLHDATGAAPGLLVGDTARFKIFDVLVLMVGLFEILNFHHPVVVGVVSVMVLLELAPSLCHHLAVVHGFLITARHLHEVALLWHLSQLDRVVVRHLIVPNIQTLGNDLVPLTTARLLLLRPNEPLALRPRPIVLSS